MSKKGGIIPRALDTTISITFTIGIAFGILFPLLFASNSSSPLTSPSQSVSIVPKLQILSTNSKNVLNFSFVNNGTSDVVISNLSVNNVTVYYNKMLIVSNSSINIYIPLNNVSINNSTATVTYMLYSVCTNGTLENVTAQVKKVSQNILDNITDVVITAYLLSVNNQTVLSYYITNFSPLSVSLTKIKFGNAILFNETVTISPLKIWNENFTLTKISNYTVMSIIENQAKYNVTININATTLEELGI